MYKITTVSKSTIDNICNILSDRAITKIDDNEIDDFYDITLNENIIIKINSSNITLDLAGFLITIPEYAYHELIIK